MKVSYREPKENEFKPLVSIINEAREPYKSLAMYQKMGAKDTSLYDLEENSQKRQYRIFAVDNKIVGFTAFKKKGQITWLSQFYISSKFQRKNYGSQFLQLVEDEAKEKSDYIVLEYWPDATWARDFYIKNGYTEDPKVCESGSAYTKILVKKIAE